jgi:hypothetical protein
MKILELEYCLAVPLLTLVIKMRAESYKEKRKKRRGG